MKKKIQRAIEISKALKDNNQTGKCFHTSFAFIRNRIIAIGMNDYNQAHPYNLFGHYQDYRGNVDYEACLHSEPALLKKLFKLNINLSKIKIINIRIDNNGRANYAAPCPNCYKLLIKNNLGSSIWFSKGEESFGKI